MDCPIHRGLKLEPMRLFFVLNESSDMTAAGDVILFDTLKKLLSYVEAIDVRNGEYFCFVSDGRKVSLSATHDYDAVLATIETSPHHVADVEAIFRQHLTLLAKQGVVHLDTDAIESGSLAEMTELIPPSLLK